VAEPVWPKDSDDQIRQAAADANVPGVGEILDKLVAITMGNAELIEYYAETWDPRAVESLTAAQEEFAQDASNINDVWTGGAADEFKAWTVKFNTALNDCKTALSGPRNTLWECSALITRTYKLAIDLVAKIATTVVKLTTGIAGLPLNVLGVVSDLLTSFIDVAAKLIGDALVTMRDYRKAMADMRSAAARLTDLVPMGAVVAGKAGWQPRPA
jgi:uncharacterized protein YukE